LFRDRIFWGLLRVTVVLGEFLNFGLRPHRLEGGASRQTSLEAARKKDERYSCSSRWKKIGLRRRTHGVGDRSVRIPPS